MSTDIATLFYRSDMILEALILAALSLIPAPKQYTENNGSFQCGDAIFYTIAKAKDLDATELEAWFQTLDDVALVPSKRGALTFEIGKTKSVEPLPYGSETDESYFLEITPEKIIVRTQSTAGAFYAVQTLRQLKALSQDGSIRCCTITDGPSLAYRGMMIDLARHFRSMEFIFKQIDALAYLKMNKLHLHLSDSEGWRLDVPSHPEMVRKAAFRRTIENYGRDFTDAPLDYVPGTVRYEDGCYGGYYDAACIQRIVEYARVRNIEVIPEIEMPGHNYALVCTHPELGCGVEIDGPLLDVCPGKEATYAFFEEVLADVARMFPGKYIHVGGDEAEQTAWKLCADCKGKMAALNLKSTDELQSSFITRMEQYINSLDKKMIGWDEILHGGISPHATMMTRKPDKETYTYKVMDGGHDVIITWNSRFYLDYAQNAPYLEPKAHGNYTSLKKLYNFNEAPRERFLGIQGCLWSGFISSDLHYEYMLYPRTFGVADYAWTPDGGTDYDTFRARTLAMSDVFREMGYNVFDLETETTLEDSGYGAEVCHLAKGATVSIEGVGGGKYKKSPTTLVDGFLGGYAGGWYGIKKDSYITVDLGEGRDIHFVSASFKHSRISVLPYSMEVQVSEDGRNYRSLGAKRPQISIKGYTDKTVSRQDFNPCDGPQNNDLFGNATWASYPLNFVCNENNIRYVRVLVTNGDGGSAMDELIIN